MDPLTHTATGILLSRAGLKHWTPLALPILVLAANAPDIDIVTVAGGSLNYVHYHRHLTHSLIGAPVLAIGVVALVRLSARKPVRWAAAFCAALVAVVSHLLLDWTNVYGIRLLLPFSGSWLRLDWTPVVDVWIWSALFIAFAGPFLGRLVIGEITSGKPKPERHGRGFAWVGLLFLLLYNGGRATFHARALAVLETRLYDGAAPERVAAMPSQNPLAWRGLVEAREFYALENVDLFGAFDPTRGEVFYKPSPDPTVEIAHRTAVFQTFLQFSQFPLWRITAENKPPDSKLVQVFDMRFGTPTEPGFHVAAVVDRQGGVLQTEFQFGPPRSR